MQHSTKEALKTAFRIIVYVPLGIWALSNNLFGIPEALDAATQKALYRILSPFYPQNHHDDIIILLIDDQSIERLHEGRIIKSNEWPLLYSDLATLLKRIAHNHPKALYVDIFFNKIRSTDNSKAALERTLDWIRQKNIPVIFARAKPESKTPFESFLARKTRLAVAGFIGSPTSYPLSYNGIPTPAYSIYKRICIDKYDLTKCPNPTQIKVDENDTISIRYGILSACSSHKPDDCSFSARTFKSLKILINSLIASLPFSTGIKRQRYNYHTILRASELFARTSTTSIDHGDLLKGKIVMLGTGLLGISSLVDTPTMDKTYGVIIHAMATDNLLTLGNQFYHGGDEELDIIAYTSWAIIAALMIILNYFIETRRPGNKRLQWALLAFSFILIFTISTVIFLVLHYAPLNALSILGLTSLLWAAMKGDALDSSYSKACQLISHFDNRIKKWTKKLEH